jgi:hypothetical protein
LRAANSAILPRLLRKVSRRYVSNSLWRGLLTTPPFRPQISQLRFNCHSPPRPLTKEAPESIQLSEPLSCGTKVNLLLFRNKGRLFVDLKGSVTNPNRTDAEGVRLTTIGLRIVEPITPGKPIVMSQGNDLRWELLVQAIRPNEQSSLQKHDGRKPDTAGGRVIMGGVEPRIIVQEEEGEERLGAVLP